MRKLVLGCAAIAATVFVACGEVNVTGTWGPSSSLLQSASPAGIYLGSFTDTSGGNPIVRPVTAIVDADGNLQVVFGIAAERHVAGRVDVSANSLTGVLAEYSGRIAGFTGTRGVSDLTVRGIVSTGVAITGEYTAEAHTGRFVLDYQAVHDTPSSFAMTAGMWSFSAATPGGFVYTAVWEIDDSGAVFGTDTLGCVFVGNIGVTDPLVNNYTVSVQVDACGYFDGDYAGMAFLGSDGGQARTTLTLSMANDVFAYAVALQR